MTAVLALLDGPSQDRLEEVADEPIPGALAIITCPVPALAVSAALALGRRMLGAEASRTDMRSVAPEGDRWLIAEVDSLARSLHVQPLRRHFVIVERADALEQRAYDRLLKTLEEPPAPTLVVLTATSTTGMPDTLVGRASVVLAVNPAPASEHISALVSAGASLSAARDAVTLAGPKADLAGPLAFSPELRSALRKACSPRLNPREPVSSALEKLTAAASAAHALENAHGEPVTAVPETRYDECSPSAKASARDILRLMADHRRKALAAYLADVPPDQIPAVAASMRAVDMFEQRLSASVPPTLCLAALAAESPAVRTHRS